MLCVCLTYENAESDVGIKSFSSHFPKYGIQYCDASFDELKTFVLWRNTVIHEPFNYDDLIYTSSALYDVISLYDGLFKQYDIDIPVDYVKSIIGDYIEFLYKQRKDSPTYSKSKYDVYAVRCLGKGVCAKCGSNNVLRLSTGTTCFDCGWKQIVLEESKK